MSEVINGLELNFVNNGGGHTATIKSILNSKSTKGGAALGMLNGDLGERYDFTNSKIQKLMTRFIAVEETESEDSNNVRTKSVKFVDKTSLMLDSHVFAVRGVSASPKAELQFEGKIYKHSEHPLSNVDSAPALEPIKYGGLIVIGKTYSVYSGSFENEPYSMGYHNKVEEEGLVFNKKTANKDSESKNLSNYSLLYGYKISEFKEAMELIGLTLNDFPDDSKTIFNISGKVSSVISSIASTLGYFWYINPDDGSINFIDSDEALNMEIQNPLLTGDKESLQNASFTQSKITKSIVNSFIGDFEEVVRDAGDGDQEDRNRLTNFYRIDFGGFIPNWYDDFFQSFYALWASQNFDGFSFDAFFYWMLFNDEDFRGYVPDLLQIDKLDLDKRKKVNPNRSDLILWDEIKGAKTAAPNNTDTGFERREAYWYDVKSQFTTTSKDEEGNDVVAQHSLKRPQELGLMKATESFFESLHNSVFVSPTYTEQQALRRAFDETNLQILGPFRKTEKIIDIEDLSFLRPLLNLFGMEDTTIEDVLKNNNLQQETPEENDGLLDDDFRPGFTKDFIFIGLKDNPVVNIKFLKREGFDFKSWLNEETVEMFFEPEKLNDIYIGYKNEVDSDIPKSIERSKALYLKVAPATSSLGEVFDENGRRVEVPDKVIRVGYRTKSKRELDDEAKAFPEEDGEDDGGGQQNTETGEDISADFEYMYFNIINNGADGDVLRPADLNSKKGMIGEIKSFEENVKQSDATKRKPLKSSSQTIYGLEIPEFDVTISSLSISLAGGGGVTTTISRSTRDLMPIDDQVIVSDFYNKATNMKSTSPRTTAGQRNLFGV